SSLRVAALLAASTVLTAEAALAAAPITPEEAEGQIGREVVVEGYVERAVCSSRACVLSFGPAFSGLVVSIPASLESDVGPGKDLEGRTVRVTGLVEAPQGRPRIEIDDAANIEKVDLTVGVRNSRIVTKDGADAAPGAAPGGGTTVRVETAPPAGPS